MSLQKAAGGRQLSLAGVLAYTALWALIICVFQGAVKLQQGVHTVAEARFSDILMLIVAGLLFIAIGLPIAIVFGRSRQAVPISLGCFAIGLIAIPILIVVLVTLGSFGVIDFD
ncbi:MAG: hypothetical protein KDB22_24520 [Planctomycetales bacterium]|nr:hypothetical protein [Planctomycetales bacterium]